MPLSIFQREKEKQNQAGSEIPSDSVSEMIL